MLIPAVAMMLLSVSACDSGIQKGTFDDVLAAIPAGASAETMSWQQQVAYVCDLDGGAGDLFGRVCRLSATDPVALIYAPGSLRILVSAISDVAVAEDATADWERVDLGRDGLAGRVCAAPDGTVILCGRLVWLVNSTEVSEAVQAVSEILDAGGGLPQPVREVLKSGADIAVAMSVEDKYLTAKVSDKDVEVEIRGELRDSTGAVYDFSEYAQPLNGPLSDRPAYVAVALGLRRGALARAVSEHLQPRLGVKQKLAYAAVSDILRDVCGTLRATLEMEGTAAVAHISMPYVEGGAATAARRAAAMTQRFELQNMVHVRAVGDTLMQLKIVAGTRPPYFSTLDPMPTTAPDKDAFMALAIAPISEGIVHLDGVEAVVHQRDFVVTLHGTDLRRLLMMARGEDDDADDEQSDE